ncbi:hypothetical protein GGX14DRAFT_672117 [Mycena pura]|uniref:F-box domain-containing protein n=1 Tax=Mycena pura TaxID=153505 RepID=A0AAD6Y347_9AGAR|nr:hypothetical protein GGX14DRAFT_672117 [Mycena pura]
MSCHQSECTSLCSVYCIPIRSKPPKSPCPDLLLNNLTPTDLQLHQVRKSIQGADEDIVRLQDAINRLSSQLGALKSFVGRHRGVTSAVRQLPNEILLEIFTHSINTELPSSSKNALSGIIRVCARWRAVALASPSLWRHFVFDRSLSYLQSGEKAKLLRQTSLQLQRSRQTPLSVHLTGYRIEQELLDTLLARSSRWQSATLRIAPSDYDQLFTSRADFTILKELTLSFNGDSYYGDATGPIQSLPARDATGFVQSLPALVDFTLDANFGHIPRGFESLWARLLACTLVQCHLEDILPILPLFSPETRVSLVGCDGGDDGHLAPGPLAISTLSLNSCHNNFFDGFLRVAAIEAPRLKKFVMSKCYQDQSLPSIATFLRESSCTLTHLALDVRYATLRELLYLLALPHTRHICALDIDFGCTPSAPIINALATRPARHDIVPNLRSFTLRNCSSVLEDIDAGLLALHARRRPILQQLWVQRRAGDLPLSQFALQALKSDGLEVVIFEHLDYW